MTSRLGRLTFVALALLAPNAALAQWTQTSSSADVELFRNHAEVSVMVSVRNEADEAVEAQLSPMIGNGAATGLAMLTAAGGSVWREATLEAGEVALARYTQMSSTKVASSPLSALLGWSSPGFLDLRMSVPASGQQFVSYKFIAPVTYERGVYKYEAPALDAVVPGFVHVHLADKAGTLTIDEIPVESGVGRATIDAPHVITYTVPTTEPVFGELAVLPTTKDQGLVDYHLDLAPRVAEVPDHARVVVLVDDSRSVSADDGRATIDAAKAYLKAFEGHDARVALVTFDRAARVVSADPAAPFAPSVDAITTLEGLALRRGNGSNLDVALAKASDLLAPEAGPKRVVLFTDLRTAARLTPEVATTKLPSSAILHIATITRGWGGLSRTDETPWAALPKATGGLAWTGVANDESTDLPVVYDELARPKRIENARVSPNVDGATEDVGTVAEGSRIQSSSFRKIDASVVTLDGELWSQPFHKVVSSTAAYRKLAAGFVFGTSAYEVLDPATQASFATLAHVVSPVTSLVTKDAANAPFNMDTFGRGGFGAGGFGASSCCCGIGHAKHGGEPTAFDPQAWLDEQVGAIALACDPGGARATVTVESTLDEIVDVGVAFASGASVASCITEKVWDLMLDPEFRRYAARTTIVN